MKWNETSEILPEEYTWILGCYLGEEPEWTMQIVEMVLDGTEPYWLGQDYTEIEYGPDYWMPLPEKPE